jgi:hypothetical protein
MHPGVAAAPLAGWLAWAAAVPLVRAVGPVAARGRPAAKAGLLLSSSASASTTPPSPGAPPGVVLAARARVRGVALATPSRGIALALGAAQTLDGLVNFFVSPVRVHDNSSSSDLWREGGGRTRSAPRGPSSRRRRAVGIFSAY